LAYPLRWWLGGGGVVGVHPTNISLEIMKAGMDEAQNFSVDCWHHASCPTNRLRTKLICSMANIASPGSMSSCIVQEAFSNANMPHFAFLTETTRQRKGELRPALGMIIAMLQEEIGQQSLVLHPFPKQLTSHTLWKTRHRGSGCLLDHSGQQLASIRGLLDVQMWQ
jgi:hypothetical protein